MTNRNDQRLTIAPIGEYYEDLLTVDSNINNRSKAQQASSLLCAKLQEREEKIKQRVEYLANKNDLTFDEQWKQLLSD
jgi:hypothetical protein